MIYSFDKDLFIFPLEDYVIEGPDSRYIQIQVISQEIFNVVFHVLKVY